MYVNIGHPIPSHKIVSYKITKYFNLRILQINSREPMFNDFILMLGVVFLEFTKWFLLRTLQTTCQFINCQVRLNW